MTARLSLSKQGMLTGMDCKAESPTSFPITATPSSSGDINWPSLSHGFAFSMLVKMMPVAFAVMSPICGIGVPSSLQRKPSWITQFFRIWLNHDFSFGLIDGIDLRNIGSTCYDFIRQCNFSITTQLQ